MKVLHLLVDRPAPLATEIVRAQSGDHEVTVVDLSGAEVAWDAVVDAIFGHDRVVCW